MEAPSAILVGHSFIKRYGRWIGSRHAGAPTDNKEVCDRLNQLDFLGTSWLHSADLHTADYLFQASKRNIVVLDCASNDLANGTSISRICTNLILFARRCLLEGAAIVVIVSAIPRERRIRMTAEQFRKNVEEFNTQLKSLCVAEQRITFHRISGFSTDEEGAPQRLQRWTDDGIHPSTRRRHMHMKSGMEKYHQSIKTALYRAVQHSKRLL